MESPDQLAEQEWKHVPRQNSLCHASASSSVNLRPAGSGVDILIRYVTRAADRLEVRNRLYQRVIDVLHKPQISISSSQPSALTAAVLAAKDPTEYVSDPKQRRTNIYS